MSSVVESGKQRSAPSPKVGKSDAVRSALHLHLRKTASFIKIMDLLVYGFAWLGGILALWFVACLIDHWLLPLPSVLRWLFWIAGVVGTGIWVIRYVGPLLLGRINESYAAKRIEHLVPEFKNGLISWLELEQLPDHGVPRGVMAALAYRAKRYIGNQDPSATVDTTPLIKLIAVLLLLCTTLIVYAMVSPKSVGVTGKRIAFPWLSLSSPARVEFLEITPGAVEITQGSELKIDVEVSGLRRGEPVELRFSTIDGQLQNQIRPLEAVTEGFRYQTTVTTSDNGVQQPLRYWLEAGDAQAGPFKVSINPLPTVVVQSVQLTYPPYTGLEPRNVDIRADVEAVEGTLATIQATSNQSMRRGILDINPVLDENSKLISSDATVEMEANGKSLSAEWRMRLDEQRNNPTNLQYQVRGFNSELESNLRPLVHSLAVLADLPPEVTLVGPDSRMLRVLPNTTFMAEIRASDPDYGLASIKLGVRKNSKLIAERQLLKDIGAKGQQVHNQQLNLGKMQLKPGDVVQLVAIAEDNRHSAETGQWDPNTVVSEPLLLEIIGANESPDIPPKPNTPDLQPEASPKASDQDQAGDQSSDPATSGDSTGSDSDGQSGRQDTDDSENGAENSGSKSSEDRSQGSDASQDQTGQGIGGSDSDDASSTQQTDNATGGSSAGSQDSSSRSQSKSSTSSSSDSGQSSGNSKSSDGSGKSNQRNTQQRSQNRNGSDSDNSAGSSSDENLSDGEVMERVRERIQQEREQNATDEGQKGTGDNATPSQSREAGNGSESAKSQEAGSENGSNGQESAGSDGEAGNRSSETGENSNNSPSQQQTDPTGSRSQGEQDRTSGDSAQGNESGKQANQDSRSENGQNQQSSESGNGNNNQEQSGNNSPGQQSNGSQSQGDSSSSSGEGGQSQGNQSPGNQSQGNQSQGNQSSSNDSSSGSEGSSGQKDSGNSSSSSDSQSGSESGAQSGSQSENGSQSGSQEGSSNSESGSQNADSPGKQNSEGSDPSANGQQQEGSSGQEGAGGQSDSPDSRGKGDSTGEQP
ncbi:MAG: hypothetical protein AAGG44_11890, partial [Planctomycetota bacterium]